MPSRRQLLVAAWLWGGTESAIDGAAACYWHDVPVAGADSRRIHVVTPWQSPARSRGFVQVRRTVGDIVIGGRGIVPYVELPTALIVAARNTGSPKAAIGVLSRALQQQRVDLGALRDARDGIGHKWCRAVDVALVEVGVGIRSAAERDARHLILSSRRVDEPRWNQWLDLGDGRPPLCADALWPKARLIHEVNGKRYHAWADQFDDMQARHDRLTAVGLIVLHNSPARIRHHPDEVLDHIERSHAFYDGQGLPPGVRLIEPPAIAG